MTGLKTALSKGERDIFVTYGEDAQPVGFATFHDKFNRFNAIYAQGNAQTERAFFDNVFNDLKIRKSRLTIPGEHLSDTLREHVEERGFKRTDMHGMSISRTSIASWGKPELPTGYSIEVYGPDIQDSSAEFMCESYKTEQVDENNPNWYETEEGWYTFLDLRTNDWLRVLRFEEMIVGMCIVIMSPKVSTVIGFAIKPAFRRKGLGKTILVHTLQDLISSKESIESIKLIVEQDNSALRVYESVGFDIMSTFPIFSWNS